MSLKKRNKADQVKFDFKIERAKMIKKARKKVPYNIAAFDQATICGVAYQISGEEPKVELWDLKIGTNESKGFKWLRFESRVKDFIKEKNIKVLAYELPNGRNTNPLLHSAKLICCIEKVCAELSVEFVEFSSSEVKKFATGNGIANKDLMKEFAERLWGYEGDDDNEADALHILHYLKVKIS